MSPSSSTSRARSRTSRSAPPRRPSAAVRRAATRRRRRSNASCSVRPSFAISSPFARSIDLRAASASASDSVSSRSAASSSCRARAVLIAGSRSLSRNGFDQVAEDTGLDRARDELVLAVRGQHHDRDRPLVEDPPRRLDPVEPRHLHVEHRQVGLLGARELDRLEPVLRLRADLEARRSRAATRRSSRMIVSSSAIRIRTRRV